MISLYLETKRHAARYKPSIHGSDYIEQGRKKFEYFKLICAVSVFIWAAFIAIALTGYFGGSNGAS
jgi:hypothetical protein